MYSFAISVRGKERPVCTILKGEEYANDPMFDSFKTVKGLKKAVKNEYEDVKFIGG